MVRRASQILRTLYGKSMSKVKSPMGNQALTVKDTVTYSMGSLGREVSNNCINVFFLAYLSIYMGLDVLILTIAFFIAKVWDTVNDPMLAAMVNNSKISKFGRYRPWIAIGALLNAASLILMFTPLGEGVNEVFKYAYYIFMYIVWGMTFTMVDVPFWSMIPTIANSTEERNKISSFAKLIGGFGGFVITTVGTSLILPNLAHKGMTIAYLVLGICAGAIMISFMSVTVMCNREKYKVPHADVKLKDIFGLFKTNDQLVAYSVSFVLFVFAITIALFQIFYLFVYCYENGANLFNHSYSYTIFIAVACTGQGIAMIFYNFLTKKVPREKIYGANYIMAILGMAAMFFIFIPLKEGNYLINTIVVALAGAFLMTASGLNQIGSTVMIADVVDYGEWKTGQRADSVIFSVQTLLAKFAGAIAMLIIGIGIKFAGLPKIVDRVGDDGLLSQVFEDSLGNVVSAADFANGSGLLILRFFMFIVPIPLCIIGYIIYKKKYTLYGERYDKIKAEIDERRLNLTEDCSAIPDETN